MAGELDEAETLLARMIRRVTPALHLALGLARNFYLQGRTEDAHAVLRQAPADDAGSLSAMHAFLDACGGDLAAATSAADAALQGPGIDDFSKMLAATAKMIAAGEQGRVDDLALTVAFARTLGETSPSTGIAPVRLRRGALLRVAITRITRRGRCGRRASGKTINRPMSIGGSR